MSCAPLWQVDAFTDRLFGGNPAAVCLLDAFLPDAHLLAIAAENNLSETAYLVGGEGTYDIRWFTPGIEVALCGHATLASAHVILTLLEPDRRDVTFHSASGPLSIIRNKTLYTMDFPARSSQSVNPPEALTNALGQPPLAVRLTGESDYLCVYADQTAVAALEPDFRAMSHLDARGVSVTAPGDDCDFVSRFFAPGSGVDEDPVTGSAHCALTPYWAEKLERTQLSAKQISRRGGTIECELRGDRVGLTGSAILYLTGEIQLPESLI